MKKIVLILIFATSILLSSSEIKTVNSIGFGETQEKALDGALKEGLAKVVGMYMSSSSFVKNYQTISDEITSFSNGYIENYTVTSTEKKDGLIVVQVEMSVKTGTLITKLKELNIATISILIDADYVKKDLKMQDITKVNQEKLTEEYYKQIIEPVKLNKSHFIKINNFEAFEIIDIPKTHYGGEVLLKNLKTGVSEKFDHSIYLSEDEKYDFMDKYYIIKVNYNFGLTDSYYNNCISFMDAAFDRIENKPRIVDIEVDVKGGDKIIVTKISSIMKTGIPDNIYKLDARTINRFKKYFTKNRDHLSYKINYKFKAYDKSGFPSMQFNYVASRAITETNNIMRFIGEPDPRNQVVQYTKNSALLKDGRFNFDEREKLCSGILAVGDRDGLFRNMFLGGRYSGNLNFFYDDYGILLNVYLAIPKIKITEIAEIKAELTTE